jgi:conjugal transfer pilus assembly protein TraV
MSITLSACSSMNGSFDCPNKAGVNCKSLDQINDMVDSGQIRGRSGFTSKGDIETESAEFAAFPSTAIYHGGAPLRYGETVQRIWVAPYEDTEGNYHQDSLMYSIVKRGYWIGSPLKSITAI